MNLSRPTSTTFWVVWHSSALILVTLIWGGLHIRWDLGVESRTFFIAMAVCYCVNVIALTLFIPKGRKIRFAQLIPLCLSIFGCFFLFLILQDFNYSRKMVIITLSVLAAFGVLSLSLKTTLQKPALYVVIILVGGMLFVSVAMVTARGGLNALTDKELEPEQKLIRTSFYKLIVTYKRNLRVEPAIGGAISIFGDHYLLATGEGHLHALLWNPEKKRLDATQLPYKIPLNREEFIRDSAQHPGTVLTNSFRTADILVQDFGKDFRLFVSHHHWNREKQCFAVRVSSARGNYSKFVSGEDAPIWETIYESTPCLRFKNKGDLFAGHQVGGKMVLLDNRNLLLAVGDHMRDGVESDEMLPQDKTAMYGKTVLIDLETHADSIFSYGHRNPQGLDVDEHGNIWETEHGPRGGDELNLIRKGKNYGWPIVTYGADYAQASWPLNASQGQHVGYERPLYAWVPSIGISAIASIKGPLFKLWKHDLLASSLADKSLWRIRVEEGRIIFAERIPIGERIRDVIEDASGRLILWTEARIDAPTQTTIVVIEPMVPGNDKAIDRLSSLERGELVFDRCYGCHKLRDGNDHSIGPDLSGVLDRPIASAKEYNYSLALKSISGKWTAERLDAFLRDPDKFAPGTSMRIPPVQDPKDRASLIEYLQNHKGHF